MKRNLLGYIGTITSEVDEMKGLNEGYFQTCASNSRYPQRHTSRYAEPQTYGAGVTENGASGM